MLKLIPANAQHIGARKEQQDSFGFSDTRDPALVARCGLLAVVADGMGGLEGGQQSSSIAVQAFMAAYARKTRQEPVPAALHRALLEANRAVIAAARQAGTDGNTGTTFAAAVVHNDLLYWIAAGDSRIYLLREGRLVQINADHTYGTTLWPAVATGQISRESALNDPQAPHLTSHLGMDDLAQVDLSERPFPLLHEDVVLVCSDGVYRAVTGPEIVEAFRVSPSPAAACGSIQAAVLARASTKQDNLTLLAVQCLNPNAALVAAPVQTPDPAALPAPNRPAPAVAHGNPSNLPLIGLLCVEIFLSLGLGAWYVRGRLLNASPHSTSPAAGPGSAPNPARPPKPSPNGQVPATGPTPDGSSAQHPILLPQATIQPNDDSSSENDPDETAPKNLTPKQIPQPRPNPAPATQTPGGNSAPTPVTPQPQSAPTPATPPKKDPNTFAGLNLARPKFSGVER